MTDIIASTLTAGSNNHETPSEDANAYATDFVAAGVIGSLTNTSGVSPATGGFAVNAAATPNMTVTISAGTCYLKLTPTGQSEQVIRGRMSSSYTGYPISDNTSGSTKYDWIYLKGDATTAANPNASASDVITLTTSRSSSNVTDDGTPPTYGKAIARVTVSNGATSITNANITDLREESTFSASSTLNVDTINEKTTDHGVTVEEVNFKDGVSSTDSWVKAHNLDMTTLPKLVASPTNNFTLSAGDNNMVLDNIIENIGGKFTINTSNEIVIGSGVLSVLVSVTSLANGITGNYYYCQIRKNGNVFTESLNARAGGDYAGVCMSSIVPVTSGDKIVINCNGNAGAVVRNTSKVSILQVG